MKVDKRGQNIIDAQHKRCMLVSEKMSSTVKRKKIRNVCVNFGFYFGFYLHLELFRGSSSERNPP